MQKKEDGREFLNNPFPISKGRSQNTAIQSLAKDDYKVSSDSSSQSLAVFITDSINDSPDNRGLSLPSPSPSHLVLHRHAILNFREQVTHKLINKTKPPLSLGRLEAIATDMAVIQETLTPSAAPAVALIFAADHGVYAAGVSPYPQAVTAQMVANIVSGGAASSVLARAHDVAIYVIDVGVLTASAAHPLLHDARVRASSRNMAVEAAMSETELTQALAAGDHAVARAVAGTGAKVLIMGEMGLANTTAATAMSCALLNLPAAVMTGPGTGLDADGIAHKTRVIEQILALHAPRAPHTPDGAGGAAQAREVLRCMGGLEIAAMVGAYLAVARTRTVLLIDGFIATAALLVAIRIDPAVRGHCLFAHTSGEPGHQHLLKELNAEPILNFAMRLGEATGALTAYPLLKSACAIMTEMASFTSAGVSDR